MMIRIAKCTVCGVEQQETQYGLGWPGWIMVDGIAIDNDSRVMLCPEHKEYMANVIVDAKEKHDGNVD